MKVVKKINRESDEIKIHLFRKGVKQVDIASALNLCPAIVARTINGQANNKRVLKKLKDLGVTQRHLGVRL